MYQKRMELFLQKSSVDCFLRGNSAKSMELARRKEETLLEIRESKIKSIGEANRLIVEI